MNYFVKYYLLVILLTAFPLNAFCSEIKIGLITTDKQVVIGSDLDSILINSFTNNLIAKISKREPYKVQNINGLIKITDKFNNTFGAFRGPIKLIPNKKNGLICCNNKWYRGELLLLTNGDKKYITIINNVEL
mgnify:CR=1 FL=1